MRYLELIFNISSFDISEKDILIARLYDFGFDSFEEKSKTLHAFILNEKFDLSVFKETMADVKLIDQLRVQVLKEKNWNSIWESSFDPVFIDKRCCVRAPFHKKKTEYDIDIIISPKMSFGTGHHSTTFLMMRQLLSLNLREKTVLDIGTGTGILSILSEKIGATDIFAIDIDHFSYLNSLENTKLNNCQHISVFQTNVSNFEKNQTFDFVLVNINKNILLNEMNNYVDCLSKNGFLILSGFLKSDFNIINDCVLNFNLKLSFKEVKKEWLCLVYVK